MRTTERRRPSRRERPSGSARSSFKIRDALQAEKREGEGGKRVGREDALLGGRKCRSAKNMPRPGKDRVRGLRRERSLPTRASQAAGWQGGYGGCCSTFICKSHGSSFRAMQAGSASCNSSRKRSRHTCVQADLGLPHIQTSPGALILTRTVQTMQFRLPLAKAFGGGVCVERGA